ncbi:MULTISPECIES: hypothetical protein [unclassified Variovorax]|uniref:hypothetical protein n=1 Tax=unclassified Variovorax TaxID=663243 RepID=UPI00076D0539|nr:MULTISPECIES: hypothetical protein [unclassified Variovorax]KWT92109.1 hypothetical protein APY03_3023 [Variovorax sp. WDL1]PNG46989.1 hypothetical protein CHC06_07332 [Variovorax sp. B2]PNG48360.1 hypothetical protein CHC07_07536 [Variovorax sp. B4]VTV14838.1 hypothetical protein WDL1CHR_05306 [Variovorax sp. WDL1]
MDEHDFGDAATFPERAQELAMQAQETLSTYHRLLEERGVTPDSCLAELRRVGGEAAVDKARREAEETLRAMDERIEREVMHAPASNRPLSRHMVRRGGV